MRISAARRRSTNIIWLSKSLSGAVTGEDYAGAESNETSSSMNE